MSKDETAAPTGMALTHLDPVFRERPDEYLDMLRAREPVHQDRMFDPLQGAVGSEAQLREPLEKHRKSDLCLGPGQWRAKTEMSAPAK